MAAAKKKATTGKVGRPKKKAAEPAAETAKERAGEVKRFNAPVNEDEQRLFINVHLPEVKKLREKLASANSNLRNAYKKAKAEGSFTKADFDSAIEMEDAEKEAKAKARIARQLVIARFMGAGLGAQLDLFLEPDRTPASDIAYEEGKQAAIQNASGGAKPKYDPSTEQFRRYMEGFHSVSEKRVKEGIKPLHPEVKADEQAKAKEKAKVEAQKSEDASAFEQKEEPSSGVAMSRADFLRQQQMKKAQAEEAESSEFSRKN